MNKRFTQEMNTGLRTLLLLCIMLMTCCLSKAEVTATLGGYTPGNSASEGAESLLDPTENSKWCVTQFSGAYVEYITSEPIVLKGYTLTTGNDNASYLGRNPRSWKLYGEDGKGDWQQIAEVTNDYLMENKNLASYHYDVTTTEAYSKFRLEIVAVQSGSTLSMGGFVLDGVRNTNSKSPDMVEPAVVYDNGKYYRLIGTQAELRWFINDTNNNDSVHNVRITDDITYSAISGMSSLNSIGIEKMFRGEIDGQGHHITANLPNYWAFITNVGGDTYIHDLCISGTAMFSFISNVQSNARLTLDKVVSDMTLTSNNSAAGLVYYASHGTELKITNCVYRGTFANPSQSYGLFNGEYMTATLENCLISLPGQTLTGLWDSFQFFSKSINPSSKNIWLINDNAYSLYFPTGCYFLPSTAVTSGEACMQLNANGADIWRQNLSSSVDSNIYPWGSDEYKVACVSYNDQTIYFNYPYAVSRPNNVSALHNEAELRWYMCAVNKLGYSNSVSLTNDITLTKSSNPAYNMIGTDEHPFKGNFNGNGHTVTDTIYATDNTYDNLALFHNVSGGTIQNLHVSGLVHSEGANTAGLVGNFSSSSNETLTVTNVVSDMTLENTKFSTATGLVKGSSGTLTVSNSAYTGKYNCDDDVTCYGLLQSIDSYGTVLSKCYVALDATSVFNTVKYYFLLDKASSVTSTYCYTIGNNGETSSAATVLTTDALTSGELCYKVSNGSSTFL